MEGGGERRARRAGHATREAHRSADQILLVKSMLLCVLHRRRGLDVPARGFSARSQPNLASIRSDGENDRRLLRGKGTSERADDGGKGTLSVG